MSQKTKLEISTFVRGLITEAGPLTFPDNASLVDENFVLLKDGSRKRRLGLDGLSGSELIEDTGIVTGTQPAMAIMMWKSPVSSFDIIVVQTGSRLFFSTNVSLPIPATPSINSGNPYILPAEHDPQTVIVGSSLRGKFVFTYGGESVISLSYDPSTGDVTGEEYRIKVRDLFGVEDTAHEVDERPLYPETLTNADTDLIIHLYNLRNQGWPTEVTGLTQRDGASDPSAIDPLRLHYVEATETFVYPVLYPSDADVIWRARASAAGSPAAVGAYSRWDVLKDLYGSTPAPKGKAIIDLFQRSTSRQEFMDYIHAKEATNVTWYNGLDLPVEDTSNGAVSQVASYAGRFFYAIEEDSLDGGDDNSPRLNTMIFFSQVIDSEDKIAKCHSEADPTSEYIFDVVDTDGGFVQIPEAGRVLKLAAMGNSLFVVCSNGVWEIHGGETAFSATNINLTKTTSVGAISSGSVVVSETLITYWAESGIYMISIDPGTLRGSTTNLTVSTIQTLFESAISNAINRNFITGVHDEVGRKIRWLYKQGSTPSIWKRNYNRELVFDIDLRAFYLNTLPSTPFSVEGVVSKPEVIYLIGREVGSNVGIQYMDYNNDEFLDFGLTDAKAQLLTGYLTGGAGSLDKQMTSLVTHFKRTEQGFVDIGDDAVEFDNPSGCIITPQWEWTNSAAAGKWGQPFQAYRLPRPYYPSGPSDPFDYGYTVITAKHGVRGRGRALSLLFESEPGKDLHILGWGLELKVDEKM